MPNVMHVTLNTNVTPASLDVDDSGNQNQIPRGNAPVEITWQLNGIAASGTFTAFEWVSVPPPPTTIFSLPIISTNGNQISISDTNTSDSTTGTWMYKLTATIGGQTYSTQVQRLTGTTKNPIIINK